ncbi:hypothetical protein Tco_0665802 [Tanacetum coccineum]
MVTIFYDNTSAIAISNNPIIYSRTKHIDIRYHFIRDHILKRDIELHFIPTEYQLADIFTKPLDELNFTRLKAEEFWCTAIAYDPNTPINDSEARPFKEYLIKFLVMNGKKPLIPDYKTFVKSTGLDYAKGTYVSYPSPKFVKSKLAKIVENTIILDRTPVLKTTFPVAWRILFTFVVQVLGGNYSSTEQVNSIQQPIAYCLLTRTKDESFRSSPTILGNSKFSNDPSKVTPIELATFMVVVNNHENSVISLPFTVKKKKWKSQTVTPTLPQSQGPEASRSLPQKRKNHKSKKTLTETQITPPTGLLEGSKQSHSVSSGNALLLSDDELMKESEDEVFEAGDEMDEDIHHTYDEETQSPSPNKDQPKSLTEDQWKKHEEVVASYADLKSEIKGFHDAAYKVHKGTEASFSTYERLLVKFQSQYGKDAEKILGSLKVIQESVKEDPALNKKVIKATKAYIKNSTNLTDLLSLIKSFDFQGLKSSVESLQARHLKVSLLQLSQVVCLQQHLLSLKGQQLLGENFTHADTKEPPSHTKGENDKMETQETEVEKVYEKETTEEVPTRPIRAVPISTIRPITRPNPEVALIESYSRPPLTDTILEILIPQPTGPVIDITPPEP